MSKISLFIKLLIIKLIYSLTLSFYDAIISLSEGVAREAEKYTTKKNRNHSSSY